MTSIKPNQLNTAGTESSRTAANARDDRAFTRIAAAGTALALGGLAVTVQAMRGEPSGIVFVFSIGTAVAFVIGAAVGLAYWALVARGGRVARWASLVLGIAGAAAFVYPLKFVPESGLKELAKGFVPVVLALAMVGGLLLAAKSFVESDSKEQKSDDQMTSKKD